MISLSMIAANQARLADAVDTAFAMGADRLHFDVEDGVFSPRFGLNSRTVSDLHQLSTLPFEAHLMVVEPERHVRRFIEAGCSIIYIHAETTQYLMRSLNLIKKLGAKAGVALNPVTPLSVVEYAFELMDMLLLLTTEPDESGENFIPSMEGKICQAKDLLSNRSIDIVIDGGVTVENVSRLHQLGMSNFVVGRTAWHAPDPSIIIKILIQARK
jgi:ribulose-phosphate 3-epimerase